MKDEFLKAHEEFVKINSELRKKISVQINLINDRLKEADAESGE